ncbi:acetolactate decarboxylase [Acetobacterium paludosum]|uniref:Alpha-acetolactate decarboxylase n=1 Tax=Acetobacterium paludosum TaxID=52693 RepID=A0A923KSM8_9FIRM|nr:acetolactate decarboxylase [Acetobacterium paludosum]MBC3888547.1 acetolactate decarboxylase [Acetobacterium paludosum]
MKNIIKIVLLPVLCVGLLAGCANSADEALSLKKNDTLYQVSTINSLLAGNYDGFISSGELKNYGDVGIGTFNALDGEMVMIDNTAYKVKSTGEVVKVSDTETTPFAVVTHFDKDATVELTNIANLDALKAELDKLIENKNLFYVFRIDGTFKTIQARSVPRQEKPYPVMTEAVKQQSVFSFTNVTGSIVGIWCPDYIGGVNVPGYHFHFISEDRTQGGHLLDVSFDKALAFADSTDGFVMAVSPTEPEGSVKDLGSELDAVEQ